MVAAPFTAYNNTPNRSPRQNVARRGAVLHHAAMTNFEGLKYLEMGAKQVSSSAIIKDHRNESMMGDGDRPWSLSSAYWDSALRSVETCNESTNGWTISDASHWELAKAVAYWSEREGWWPHRSGSRDTWTVIGHNEVYTIHGASYATACPGGMNINLVVARAQELRGGAAAPAYSGGGVESSPTGASSSGIPKTDTESDGITGSIFNKRLQLWAKLYGGYTGPIDGVMGVNSFKGVQTNLAREYGYGGSIDGVPGINTWKAVQRWAARYGYSGPIDGYPGPNTWRAVAKALNTL